MPLLYIYVHTFLCVFVQFKTLVFFFKKIKCYCLNFLPMKIYNQLYQQLDSKEEKTKGGHTDPLKTSPRKRRIHAYVSKFRYTVM